jgi:hypothetical protein
MPAPDQTASTASKNRLRRESYAKLGDKLSDTPPVSKRMDPFSVNGAPGPLGLELLAKFAGMSAALARPVSLEDVMDGLRPRWAVGALARCVKAGWIERLVWKDSSGQVVAHPAGYGGEKPDVYMVTAAGWEVRDGKRAA